VTATCWRNLVPTFADKGVSRGQRGRSPAVVNLIFLDPITLYISRETFHNFKYVCSSFNVVLVQPIVICLFYAKWAEVCCAIDVLTKDLQLKVIANFKHFNI
jgi:hypothetical protein